MAQLGFGKVPDLALGKVPGLPKYQAEKHGETLNFHVCASGLARLGFGKVPDLPKYQIWHLAKCQIRKTHADHSKTQ